MHDDQLAQLYAAIKEKREATPTIRELPADERRRYNADAVAEHRKRQREAILAGSPEPTNANVRTALADAAIAILATDGLGAEEIRRVLASVFDGKAGVPLTVSSNARSGRLKPKLLKL